MENEKWILTPLEWLTIWQTVPEMVTTFFTGLVENTDVIFDDEDVAKIQAINDETENAQRENDALGVELQWDLTKIPAQGDFTLRTLAMLLNTVVVLQEINAKHGEPCEFHAYLAGVGAKAVIQALAGAEIITE